MRVGAASICVFVRVCAGVYGRCVGVHVCVVCRCVGVRVLVWFCVCVYVFVCLCVMRARARLCVCAQHAFVYRFARIVRVCVLSRRLACDAAVSVYTLIQFFSSKDHDSVSGD